MSGSPSDKVNVVLFNTQTKFMIGRCKFAQRSDGIVEIQIPKGWLDADIHAWIYFTSTDRKTNSTSQHITIN